MRTSLYSMLCIVIRLGALLLFVWTVASLPAAWVTLQAMESGSAAGDGSMRGMLIGFSGAAIAAAVAFWLYPGWIARLAGANPSRESFESSVGAQDMQYIALSVLGVAFAMSALVGLAGALYRLAVSAHFGDIQFTTLAWRDGGNLLVLVLKFVLGIGLAFGARGLAGVLHRLRERGLSPPVSETDDQP